MQQAIHLHLWKVILFNEVAGVFAPILVNSNNPLSTI
jgi:hypothetical protein